MEDTTHWVAEQKKEDIFDEIIYNSKKTNLTHLRRVGWTSFPVSHTSHSNVFPNHAERFERYCLVSVHFLHVGRRDTNFSNYALIKRIVSEHRRGNCFWGIYLQRRLNEGRLSDEKETNTTDLSQNTILSSISASQRGSY